MFNIYYLQVGWVLWLEDANMFYILPNRDDDVSIVIICQNSETFTNYNKDLYLNFLTI